MSAVLYARTTERLRQEVGPGALVAVALLGLAAAGRDVAPYRREALAALAGELAPDVRAALERLFFGPSAASTLQAARLQGASGADEAPLMTVAALDALDDDPLDVGREI